jgi:hypothetical protein
MAIENGRRSAAMTGGSTALSTPMSAATTSAEPNCSSSTPGTTVAAARTASAATIQERIRRSGRKRGFAGFQVTASPYVLSIARSR